MILEQRCLNNQKRMFGRGRVAGEDRQVEYCYLIPNFKVYWDSLHYKLILYFQISPTKTTFKNQPQ